MYKANVNIHKGINRQQCNNSRGFNNLPTPKKNLPDRKSERDMFLHDRLDQLDLTDLIVWASLVAQIVKNMPGRWRPEFDPWVEKIPWRRHGNPLQYSCLENPHEQRSLEGYSP